MVKDCPLCAPQGELEVVRTDKFRVIRVDDPGFPGILSLNLERAREREQ